MKTLALSADRRSVASPGRPVLIARPASRPAESSAGGPPPIVFAADSGPAWADTQPGYHVRRFGDAEPDDTPRPPPQV